MINPKYYCQFIGSVRSGHTIVSQVLNSHKDVVISDELNAVGLSQTMYRDELFKAIITKDKKSYKSGYPSFGYKYPIGHYQGKTEQPLVIGDKFAGGNTTRFLEQKNLDKFMQVVGKPFKFVWVIRNPIDQIQSKVKLANLNGGGKFSEVETNIRHCKMQDDIARRIEKDYDVKRVYLDELIYNTEQEIIDLMNFFELDIDSEHIRICKGVFFKEPHGHGETDNKALLEYYQEYLKEKNDREKVDK